MDRVQVSGKETRKINYRNDQVKYDLNFTTTIPIGFKRFKGTVEVLGSGRILLLFITGHKLILRIFKRI